MNENLGLVNLQNVVDDPIEEVTVVSDQQQGSFKIGQIIFQPNDGVGIKMVGWLVKNKQVGRINKNPSDSRPATLAT